MKLHEAIKKVLEENNNPLSVEEITMQLNIKRYYERDDHKILQNNQIAARIKNYNFLFDNINGIIILTENKIWKNIITSYWYLKEVLRGIFSEEEIQFIIAGLFFYKRLIDINDRNGRSFPLNYLNEPTNSIHRLIDNCETWIRSLEKIDLYLIAPEGIFLQLSKELFKLDSIKRETVRSLIKHLDTSSFPDSEFGKIYEYILYLNSKEYFGYENSTPESLRFLIPKLLKLKKNDSVYDPVAGLGGLLTRIYNAEEYHEFHGCEINKRIAQLANMNFMMHGINDISVIAAKDCFADFDGNKFDNIIADLPINGVTNSYEHSLLYNKFGFTPSKSEKSFNSLILLSYYKLSQNGKAVLTVSDSFLFKKGNEKNIRKLLINRDVVEAVISLPKGTYRPYHESKTSILILNNNKSHYLRGKIKFIKIDALEESRKHITLNDEQIIKEYQNEVVNSKYTQILDLDDIGFEYDLSAEKYDIQFSLGSSMLKEGLGKQIKEIARIISGKQPTKDHLQQNGNLPVIKIENLSKEILDINLNVNTSDLDMVINIDKYSNSIISQECILIAKIGENLKPTLYRPSQDLPKILIHSGVLALIPKDINNVDLEYLYYQLYTTFVNEQINSRRAKALIPYLNISTIEQIIIPFIEIDIQIKFRNTQKANLIAEESKRFEDKKKALGYEEEIKESEINIIKSLTHQLNPKFLSLSNLAKRIQRVIKNNDIEHLKEFETSPKIKDLDLAEFINEPENNSIFELLRTFENDSEYLAETINNVDKALNLRLAKESLEEVDILKYLQNYKKQKSIANDINYQFNIKGISIKTLIDKSLFKESIDNLLYNAEKHGFIDKNKKDYSVNFNVKENYINNIIVIEYFNNGATFNLTQEDFETAFITGSKSKGLGVGGNLISKVIEAHQGKLTIDENYNKGFFLTIELPIKNLEDYE